MRVQLVPSDRLTVLAATAILVVGVLAIASVAVLLLTGAGRPELYPPAPRHARSLGSVAARL